MSTQNHLPSIIKQLPKSIELRLSQLPTNKEIFKNSVTPCNEALMKAGYKHNIRYQQNIRQNTSTNKNRKRNTIWFNPPYSVTKVGKHLLSLLYQHFPHHNKFHKIFNRNTVKISYSCLPNMKAIINSHNHKVANTKTITKDRTCNCVDKAKCPLSQNCFSLTTSFKKQDQRQLTYITKKKSSSAQLKLCSSCDTHTIKDHLNF